MPIKPGGGMSDNTSKQSVRQLPPGKLENLLKRFEDVSGDSKDSPSTRGERHGPPPQPMARLKSPERPKLPTGKKPQLSPPPKRPLVKPPQPPSKDFGSSAPAGARAADSNAGLIKPQPPVKPAVQRKPSNVGDTSTTVIDNPVYGGFQQKDQEAVSDLYSKVKKTPKNTNDSPKKVSLDQEQGNIHRREAVRKHSGERRKTVAGFDTETENGGASEGSVSVAMRTKLFDGQSAGKPVPPKKSEAVRSMSMRTSREREQLQEKTVHNNGNVGEEIYDPPWDSTKSSAVEKLRQSHQAPQSASDPPSNAIKSNKGLPVIPGKPGGSPAKPPPLPSQPPPKTTGGKKTIPDSISKPSPNTGLPKPPHAAPTTKDGQVKPVPVVPKVSPPKPPHVASTGKEAPAKSISVTPATNTCPPKPPHLVPGNKDSPVKPLPVAPPPKPPRTHAHDNYLISKFTKDPEPRDQQTPKKKVNIVEPDTSEEVEYFSVKDRLAKLMQQQNPESQSPGPSSNASTPSSTSKDQEVTMRQKPPSRPPPPKHRPGSGESNASSSPCPPARPLTHCPETKHSHGGPIIIPVFPRGQQKQRQQQQQQQQLQPQHPPHINFHRQSSTHDGRRRKPTDDLPEEPDGLRPLQRFPLRKSFSSECVHSSRSSSLNLSTAGTWGDSSAGTAENYPAAMTRSAHDYEAVIDPDGYAVPNEFVRLPQHSKDPQLEDQMVSKAFFDEIP
ncbi:hypothetical protein ElyMa_001948800 [Elysia marginata]|uniref:WH2 domain-containing protein n=1 Tax=Elysia marginata TaxID=1093978 RepID=A0AAV4EYH6_9GAST|nr:hypothetical protein ElyMa_001948800 [Elysia marginata]